MADRLPAIGQSFDDEPHSGYVPVREPKADRPLAYRYMMAPVGEYEDGSFTLAWPKMITDMYEGAVRSFEQGRQLPRVDSEGYYAGTPRAEPLDAFNAASAAPMAGVAGRVSGAVPKGALGSGGSDLMRVAANDANASAPSLALNAMEKPQGARAFLETNTVLGTGKTSLPSAYENYLLATEGGAPPMSVADFNQAARDAGMVSGKQIDGHVIGPDTKWYHGTDLPTDASLSVPDGAYGLHFSRQREIAGDYADVRGHLRGYEGGIARPFTMPPTGSPNYSEALARAQEMLPGFDGTKASLFANSESYNKILREKGYDGILSKDGVLLDDPYEAIAFYPERMDRLFANDANASYSSLLLNSEDGQHRSFIDDLPRISTRDE